MNPTSGPRTFTGTVTIFDFHRGTGLVQGDDGSVWPFHCIEIADGSRGVEPGRRVAYSIDFRVLRLEAVSLAPVESAR